MFAKIRAQMNNAPIKSALIFLGISAVFILAAVYVYRNQVSSASDASKYVPNKEFRAGGDKDSTATIYFFYTTWCPHCKTARPSWDKFKEQIGSKEINGTKLTFVEVDCDQDSATADKYNVKGYPTIKLVKGDEVIEFDAKPEVDSLNQFVQSSL